MHLRRFWLFCAALVASACAAASSPTVPPVTELILAADGEARLSYKLAPDAPATLRFANPSDDFHRVVRSAGWKYDERCFSLTQAAISVTPGAACGTEYIRLDWDDKPRDRIYPALVRLRNGGVLVFASYLQVLTADGARIAPTRLIAPPGGVAVFRDAKSSSELLVDGAAFQHDGRGWFYLGPDKFVEEEVARLLVDDGVAAAARAQIMELAPRLMRFYGERLGRTVKRPVFYLTWSAREDPVHDWQADVVPGEARFGLRGRAWADATTQAIAPFRGTIAHELAHFWNGSDDVGPAFGTPWISEGTAELFAAAGLLHEGAIDAQGAASRLETAMTECLLMVGSRSWVDFPTRGFGRAPYACGFAMQFAIAAAAGKSPHPHGPFSLWKGVWQEWAHYYEASLTQFLERDGDAALARQVHEMLTRKDVPLQAALAKLLSRGEVAMGEHRAMSRGTLSMAAGAVVGALMSGDCNRSYSLNRQDGYIAILNVPCKTFRNGMSISFVAGHDVFVDPFAAAADARKACDEGRPVILKSRDGSTAIDVPCASYTSAELPSEAALRQFRAEDVQRVLLGP